MKLIIGLGNPDAKYELTRHNYGFIVVHHFAETNQFPEFSLSEKFNSLISEKNGVLLVLPQTYMNESGQAIKKIKNYYKISPTDILVTHDDIDLPLGTFRISQDKNAAGHKGVQSIIEATNTKNFFRCRMGIGSPTKKIKAETVVLKKFSKKDLEIVEKVIEKAIEEIQQFLTVNNPTYERQK